MNERLGQLRHALAVHFAVLLRKGFWGVTDQAVVSASNFLTMILLARVLSPAAFGTFVLVHAVFLFMNSLQMGLIVQPHNVLGASRDRGDYTRYTSSMLVGQIVFAVLQAVLLLSAAAVSQLAGWGFAPLLVAATVAVVAWQMQEFVRRVYYTEERVSAAFVNDLIKYGGQGIGLIALWQLGMLTGASAFYMIAATSTVGAIIGFRHNQPVFRGRFDRGSLRDSWHFGKWLFGARLVATASSQSQAVLVAAFVGVAGAGVFKAAQNLVAPTHVIMNALTSIAVPRASHLYTHSGLLAMRAYLVKVAVVASVPLFGYLIVVGFMAEWLLRFLYAGPYVGYMSLVWLFCLLYGVIYLAQVTSLFLIAMQRSRAILYAQIATAVAMFTADIPLIWQLGPYGAPWAEILGNIGFVTVVGVVFFRTVRETYSRHALPSIQSTIQTVPLTGGVGNNESRRV